MEEGIKILLGTHVSSSFPRFCSSKKRSNRVSLGAIERLFGCIFVPLFEEETIEFLVEAFLSHVRKVGFARRERIAGFRFVVPFEGIVEEVLGLKAMLEDKIVLPLEDIAGEFLVNLHSTTLFSFAIRGRVRT